MKKGFTIIELLVVVSVIAILSGISLSVLNSKGVRAKARDSQRIGDLKQIQTALELYFTDNRSYPPESGSWVNVSSLTGELVPGYINALPVDPKDTGDINPCSGSVEDYAYTYYPVSSGAGYVLATMLEVETSSNDSPCTSTPGFPTGLCINLGNYCYGVSNP